MIRVKGPIAGQIHDAFIEDWQFATGESLSSSGTPTPSSVEGRSFARVLTDGPDEEVGVLSTIIASVISSAEKSISFMTPYFLPTLELATAIESAALRGVTVSILLPGRDNFPYVHWASQHILGELLSRGVSAYFQPPPFVHTKLLLIDDHYVQIGSANLDSRRLRLNFEIGVEIFDAEFAAFMSQHFATAREQSRPLTLAELDGRSRLARTRDALCWLMSPYM